MSIMMNSRLVAAAIKPTLKLSQSVRLLSTTRVVLGKSVPRDRKKGDKSENLMENAPNWEENNATESEADVKADHEPNDDPQILKEKTAEWVRSHKDAQGNLKK